MENCSRAIHRPGAPQAVGLLAAEGSHCRFASSRPAAGFERLGSLGLTRKVIAGWVFLKCRILRPFVKGCAGTLSTNGSRQLRCVSAFFFRTKGEGNQPFLSSSLAFVSISISRSLISSQVTGRWMSEVAMRCCSASGMVV